MRKGNGYWTKEKCKFEALKYDSRKQFCDNSVGAYRSSIKNKWIDEICSHMIKKGNHLKRCIYSYEFSDNFVYVGLTYNLNERQKSRNKNIKDKVILHIKETNLQPIIKQLTDYLSVDEAIKLEYFYVEKYKNEGWNILNKSKTGGIGGNNFKWTKEKCLKESLKYKNRNEFSLKSPGSYRSSLRCNWLDEICSHMIKQNIWNKENCKKEALKYSSRFEFSKNSKSSYSSSLNNGWLDEICEHMGEKKMKRNYWNYETCKTESLKYKTKTEFSIKSSHSYKISRINKWLNDFFKKN